MADAASLAPITCLLTIHGIGFQQFPDDDAGVAGYADELHRALRDQASPAPPCSATTPSAPGVGRPPVTRAPSMCRAAGLPNRCEQEKGLERLGRLLDREARTLQSPLPDLVEPGKTIAHVALVYTPLEETGPDPIATLELTVRGLFSAAHYATLTGGLTMLGRDVKAILHPPAGPPVLPPRAQTSRAPTCRTARASSDASSTTSTAARRRRATPERSRSCTASRTTWRGTSLATCSASASATSSARCCCACSCAGTSAG